MELYLFVGKAIALSILNGGPGPTFFSPLSIDYLFGGITKVKPSVDDIPDMLIQDKISKVYLFMCLCTV